MAPSCPADARNPVLALCTQSSSQSPGSSAGHGEEMREAPSPFPGKGKRDGETAWLQPLGAGNPRHGVAAGGREGLQGYLALAGWQRGGMLAWDPSGQEGAGHPCPGRGPWPLQGGRWAGRKWMLQPCPGFPRPQPRLPLEMPRGALINKQRWLGRAWWVPVLLERGWCRPRAVLGKGPGPASCFSAPAHVCEEQCSAQRHL